MRTSPRLAPKPRPVPALACLATALLSGPADAQVADIRLVGPTKYLNNAKAVVIHTIDDSTKLVVDTGTISGHTMRLKMKAGAREPVDVTAKRAAP